MARPRPRLAPVTMTTGAGISGGSGAVEDRESGCAASRGNLVVRGYGGRGGHVAPKRQKRPMVVGEGGRVVASSGNVNLTLLFQIGCGAINALLWVSGMEGAAGEFGQGNKGRLSQGVDHVSDAKEGRPVVFTLS